VLIPVAERPADQQPGARRAEDDREQDQREERAAQAEEQGVASFTRWF
jgi:hypothetical protein